MRTHPLALVAALTALTACSQPTVRQAVRLSLSPESTASPTTQAPPTPTAGPTLSPSPALKPSPSAALKPSPSPPHAAPTPRPAPFTPSGLAGRVIVIDPGHNGQNWAHPGEISRLVNIGNGTKACDTTGTASLDGYTEAAYNLDVASRLAGLLTAAGAHVILTRSDNNGWGPCIDERAAIANRAHADVAISIHADGSPVGRGFHVIFPVSLPGLTEAIAAPSQRLAVDIRDAYAAGSGVIYSTYAGHNGLDQRSDLGGLNLSRVPKVFIETGNMRNSSDAALLEDPAFRSRAANALAAGLAAFLAGH